MRVTCGQLSLALKQVRIEGLANPTHYIDSLGFKLNLRGADNMHNDEINVVEIESEEVLFENRFVPDKKALSEYYDRVVYRINMIVLLSLWIVLVFASLILLEWRLRTLIIIIIALIVVFIRKYVDVRNLLKHYELRISSGMYDGQIKFYENNFIVSKGTFSYNQISKIIVGKHCVFIIVEKALHIIVKKDAFIKGDYDSFVEFLKEKLKDNRKALRGIKKRRVLFSVHLIPALIIASFFLLVFFDMTFNHVTIDDERVRRNVQSLDLSGRQISDLTQLQPLRNLTWLNLSDNQITDLTPLESLTNLRVLMLYDNRIYDLVPLESLTNLTVLELSKNNINDVAPLQSLTNLNVLGLSFNNIEDITPLQSLYNLTELYLHDNQLVDISSIQYLSNLTLLRLGDNQITDVRPLQSLANLSSLSLFDNYISNTSPLRGLENLTELWIGGNPLTTVQINELRNKLPDCEIHWW